ncbi:uncharacterized protein LOC133190707 [Saccostrea echinata]|uniref:uncharacterized protein LOC133190707 n=1 Tax=Saccostrea echinata TaxID=191078 RepID=UPI002A81CE4F|nr:uncharacterized protein LOC133190707 [Saccostrea echinata]
MDSIRTSQIKAVIQHVSESVFVGLCHKLGTSQQVATRRDVMDIKDMVSNQVTTTHENSFIVSGSRREGFRLKESDRDFMAWPNDHRVIWDLSQSRYYNTYRQKLILCDCSNSPPGFTLLFSLSSSINRKIQRACVRMNDRHYISSTKYREILCSVSSRFHPHGPCVSGIFGTTEYDCANCFVCDFWPPSASSWIDRCDSWPKSHIVDDIVQNGCHVVPIGHKLGNHEHNEWRISFSLAEQKLVYSMNHCQFSTYGLLKLFLTELINKGLRDDDKLLCSYHMKTSVFWVIQKNSIPEWCPQNLLDGFWVCFKLILKWVHEGVCPNFFIPGNNMFLSKIHGEAQHQLFIRLYGLYEKGLASLLHIPSIGSCIINVFHNPRLSICTHEHSLTSESYFDVNLFHEIHSSDILISLNLQDCMKHLHTIEHMIGSLLLTECQVIMLQKLTAYVLQKNAFILHMKTCILKNKPRYGADKISCHMLKLAANFGCITDMLYIAMYYYNTLRYMKALSIVEIIKVKLAQPYVMLYNVDIDMYNEAMRGQTWSTKMRQAVAWNITICNQIHYISELIPEQQSCLQSHIFLINVPPVILLYMLEILCYRHVDTMRAQTALDDLQTLVHNDKGELIDLKLRDISWQILGICQQVTGNLQAALYSYHQSLRVPLHKIQTATELRIQGICQLMQNT